MDSKPIYGRPRGNEYSMVFIIRTGYLRLLGIEILMNK